MAIQTMVAERAPRMVRVGEAAQILQVHPNTIRKWSSEGLIPSYRIGRRRDRRFTLEDLDRFLASHRSDEVAMESLGEEA